MSDGALVPGTAGTHTVCLLLKLGQVAFRITEDSLLDVGLRIRHYSVMQALEDEGGMSQAELASYLRIDPATVVSTLDDLERHGLAVRRRHSSDRRRYVVELSDQGRRTLPQLNETIAGAQDQVLETLAADERQRLGEILAHLNASAPLGEHYETIRRTGG